MPDVRIDGTNFHYRLDGPESAPLVVLSHSLATDHSMWRDQLPPLTEHFRVLSYDMRGHGKTDDTGEDLSRGYTLEQLADDVAHLVAKLGHSRFHYVGLSIGGMIGQVLAVRHRQLVRRLVLCCTGTGRPSPEQEKMWEDRLVAVAKDGTAPQVEGTLARWFSPEYLSAAPQVKQWIGDLIRATPRAGYIGAGHAIRRMNIAATELESLRLPALVIAGEMDPGATVAAAETIRSRIQGAQLVVIKGGYHLCNIEKAQDFNAALLGFLLADDGD
jgi:3-oxoadipate enol-lactonase